MGRIGNSISSWFVLLVVLISLSQAFAEDRCKDDSFCRAFCLSTNPTTVSARCGIDLQSCICMTGYNQAVKVRFIEERRPVPSTTPMPSTTPRPIQVNSQTVPTGQYNYNGNGNSIAGNGNPQQQQFQTQQDQLTPVLLECDASESSTRMCHMFCTMEIRAWYGLCNITSKACACFGIPLSAVQKEPIAAIFHSTAPVAPTPPKTPRPTPAQMFRQPYPQQPQNFQQQQWQPIPPSASDQQTPYPYPPSPSVLSPAPQNNQLQDQGPVRSVAGMFGTNGKPVSPSILTPAALGVETTPPAASSFTANLEGNNEGATGDLPTTEGKSEIQPTPVSRKRRSLNDTPLSKGKDVPSNKDFSMKGECTKFKCGIACKRSQHFAPDCVPKCFDGQCMCECTPRL